MKIAIVGFGSIGQKHYNNFKQLGCKIAVVSQRSDLSIENVFKSIEQCEVAFAPDIYFVCNKTSDHYKALIEIKNAGFKQLVVVEKPVFASVPQEEFGVLFSDVRVSYNLRFNALLKQLKNDLKNEKVISAVSYVGQYLPQWRPATDYRMSYSADSATGGGVLLDLSHELDYLFWLTGKASGVFAIGGKLSGLEIKSEDAVHMAYMTDQNIHVSVHLNYLDRMKNRFLILNTAENTYKLDLINNQYFKNDTVVQMEKAMNKSYEIMATDIVKNKATGLTTYNEAVDVLKFISACRESLISKKWISL